jgi:hypothetical protein
VEGRNPALFGALAQLERKDKWFLGGGKGAIYAPPFPRWLQVPGFWDECYLADIRLLRLFCLLFLGEGARPIRTSGQIESWRPDRLVLRHRALGLEVIERRCVLEENAWISELEIMEAEGPVNVMMWSLQEFRPHEQGSPWTSIADPSATPDAVTYRFDTGWPSEMEPDRTAVEVEELSAVGSMLPPLPVYLALGSSAERLSWTINLAQRHDDSPLWETSVVPEKFADGRLPGDEKVQVGPPPVEGLLHLVQHYRLQTGDRATFAAGSGLSAQAAAESLEAALAPNPIERSESSWRRYFAGVPQFESSDPWLTSAYWYRWYGLRLNTVDLPDLPVARPAPSSERFSPFVTEGIGFFRNFITYSAQAHLREAAWVHDPSLAIGILDNLTKVQRDDGSFPGHSYSCRPPRDFYHADFATGADLLEALHPGSLHDRHLDAFARYGAYFWEHRRLPADPNLYVILDQNETGQEYMSRYQEATADADRWSTFCVGGVDASTYMALLCDFMGRRRGGSIPGAELAWEAEAEDIVDSLLHDSLDQSAHFFCDIVQGRRARARPATGFYPFLLSGQSDWRARAEAYPLERVLDRWLLSEEEFWLPRGFPATAQSDQTFSAEAEWKEKRLNCLWNGRSWPMVNSHLVDALASAARNSDSARLRQRAGEALMKVIRLMFYDGEPGQPNSFEHYNPETGIPATYRGYDDYMHSWIVDLILRHAVGVVPGTDAVDPLPLAVDWIRCTHIPHPKGWMHVQVVRGEAIVTIEPREP